MTDTRTTETTSEPTRDAPAPALAPESAEPAPAAAAEPARETPRDTEDRIADPGQAERLSTADVARGEPDAATQASDGNGRSHASALPGPSVAPLFSDDASNELRDRWTDVQAGFVDEPRSAVEQADALVAEVMKRLADGFATERQALEQQWSSGGDASTEDLRVALRRYRSFFDRLLSI
jgi:hypothetical protein